MNKKLIINDESWGKVNAYHQNRYTNCWVFEMEDTSTVSIPFGMILFFSLSPSDDLDITTYQIKRK